MSDYYERACPDCGTVYEQRYYHALGACEPCNASQAAIRSGRATLAAWLTSQVPEQPQPTPPAGRKPRMGSAELEARAATRAHTE